MKLATLEDLFIEEMKDIYSAETQLVKALPKMAKAASSPELREAIQEHLDETKEQARRIERICASLDISPKGKKCKGMEGLISEGAELIEANADSDVLDAAIIGAAQRVEHYEIASYGCARTYAQMLGHEDAAELLQESLDEESAADEKLTELAESVINAEALAAEED